LALLYAQSERLPNRIVCINCISKLEFMIKTNNTVSHQTNNTSSHRSAYSNMCMQCISKLFLSVGLHSIDCVLCCRKRKHTGHKCNSCFHLDFEVLNHSVKKISTFYIYFKYSSSPIMSLLISLIVFDSLKKGTGCIVI